MFAWLILRNYRSEKREFGGLSNTSILKPMLIALMYYGSQQIGAPFLTGFKNPNIVL